MFKQSLFIATLFSTSLFAFTQQVTSSNEDPKISYQQLKQDVSYLADDKLEGRSSFSPQSNLAAEFIAKRFGAIGLKPLEGENNFKQQFEIFQVSNNVSKLSLNGDLVATAHAFILGQQEKLHWDSAENLTISRINADDDFRKQFRKANFEEKNQVVLIDNAHQAAFERYKSYFGRPKTNFEIKQGPSALFVLTRHTEVSSIKLSAAATIEKHVLTNVVGVLPGQQKAEEMVLFSAHYDHLPPLKSDGKKQESIAKDVIYNGADDNASGTAGIINLAQHYAKTKNNQRSLVFVAFAAEEIGGFGSQYFSKQLPAENITAMINLEMIGKVSKFGQGGLWMTGFERSDLATILNANLKASNKTIHPDPYPKQQLFYRSDNATLARLGVPAHSFSASQIDIDKHYHQVSDQVDTLDIKSMQMLLNTIAESTSSLIEGTDTPTRIDTTEVKSNNKGQYY